MTNLLTLEKISLIIASIYAIGAIGGAITILTNL
jgi:hypothetical protein